MRPMNPEEQKHASAAQADFNTKKYTLCIQHLALLSSLKPNNMKVQHNKRVAELYASNYKNIEAFQKDLTAICTQAHVKLQDSDTPDDVDHCIIYYNQSVIYYHLKQYETALNVLIKIFPLIQPMEESLSFKVCYLLLELFLLLNHPEKAHAHVISIESQFFSPKMPDDGTENPARKERLQQFRANILHYKAKSLLRMKSFDLFQKVLDYLSSNKMLNFSSILMRAQLSVLKGDYQNALDEIIVIQEDVDNFWKLGDERMLIYYNNIALIYYYCKKHHLSLFFINKAYSLYFSTIEKIKKSPKESSSVIKPTIFQGTTFLKIMYNRGLAFLNAKKPSEAFDCFTVAVQGMLRSPLIWLRLAECCIMMYKRGNEGTFNLNEKRKDLVTGRVGVGACSKICLNNKLYKDTAFSSEPQSYAVPMPNLEFATVCLRNSFALLPPGNSKLRQGVLAACCYVHLTIADPVKAYKFAKLLLAEATTRVYKYLGRLYLSESLFMLNKFPEAIEVLNPSHFAECDPSTETEKQGGWVPSSQLPAQAVLHYNLATLLTMRGDLDKASELLKHVWLFKASKNEIPIHILALALYIELVFGRIDVAKTIIKQNCPQVYS